MKDLINAIDNLPWIVKLIFCLPVIAIVWSIYRLVRSIAAGNILVRQRGTKIHPGVNVKKGSDDTLFAVANGKVKFERLGRDKKQVSVYEVVQ